MQVVPYQPEWATEFAQEAEKLNARKIPGLLEILHIGSTSVEGLAAKPVIDIMLSVESLALLDENRSKFEDLGYEVMGEYGIPRRRFYRKGGKNRTHHIHAFPSGDQHLNRHLAFREYLRKYPEIRQQYAELKLQVASECENDIERYCEGKDAFITYYEARALEWMKESRGPQS